MTLVKLNYSFFTQLDQLLFSCNFIMTILNHFSCDDNMFKVRFEPLPFNHHLGDQKCHHKIDKHKYIFNFAHYNLII